MPKSIRSHHSPERRSTQSNGRNAKEKRKFLTRRQHSLSDESCDDDSADSEQGNESVTSKSSPPVNSTSSKGHGKGKRRSDLADREWEILEGLREDQTYPDVPEKFEGYISKRRKWPLKGWHKRYFVLEKGILIYTKSPNDILKGKYHGSVDIGLSVVSYKSAQHRFHIDHDDLIYHLKVKGRSKFEEWVNRLRNHRLYRQHEIAYGTREVPKLTEVSSPIEEITSPITSPMSPRQSNSFIDRPHGSFRSRSLASDRGRVAAWLLDSAGIEKCDNEMQSAQSKIFELSLILEKLKQSPPRHVLKESITEEKNRKEKIWLKKSNSREKKTLSQDYNTSGSLELPNQLERQKLSTSNPNLNSCETDHKRPVSMSDALLTATDKAERTPDLHEEYYKSAKDVHTVLKSLSRTITTERERLKKAVLQENHFINNNATVQSLKNALAECVKQNAELTSRLQRIHQDSTLTNTSSHAFTSHTLPPQQAQASQQVAQSSNQALPASQQTLPSQQSLSNLMEQHSNWMSIHKQITTSNSLESASISEFYDAPEYIGSSEESSEASDDEEASSDISDTENPVLQNSNNKVLDTPQFQTGRRSVLPCPRPDNSDISLWGLLSKNIGKDLSKISMPVTLNEPLNTLQRLCEELEYSDLLDKAAETDDPYKRMILVVAFAVSPYASTYYRAGQKPFNPLLGETYECIREDRGWRFIAEQVSHHPPISACYCDSKNFIFWQDMRVKSKFWGKSMEIHPIGLIQLKLPKYKDHYQWNKVTTCVHNILGGQRWVDHYGEISIKNQHNNITCKLTFTKSSYWSSKRHEFYGSVMNAEGKVMHQVFGRWNEGIYFGHAPSAKCVWRPSAMPEDYEAYYGFTRFAIELNEIDEEQARAYAPTDTRFRPDQRALEEGRIQDAELEKLRVETAQRERRKRNEEEKAIYSPRWFMKYEEDEHKDSYMYTGKYWEIRKDPGFMSLKLNKLW